MVYSVVVQSGLLPGGGGRHGRRPLPRGAYEFLREGWYWVIKSLVFVVCEMCEKHRWRNYEAQHA
jgi:hypothetical protein